MKDLGSLKYFLGVEILRSDAGIVLNQRKYALELIEDAGLKKARVAVTPIEKNQKLTTVEFDETLQLKNDDKVLADATIYQRLIGRLLYLTNARPDITYSVQHLSQFMHKPKKSHYTAALRIVRYIKSNPGQEILLSSDGDPILTAYCDSDWTSCLMSTKSIPGYCIKLGSSLISWKSKNKVRSQNLQQKQNIEAWHLLLLS
ncbi:uncharacterized mitochondrial protein AtMg00240-like [Gossypium hirsutum]|uniref:Uncharacterized mitochondrial protein AtMg00240-like n=1 Tax=Gossypium hirsutum TaxID=3635 RepID=A0A1U8PB19_GOSHI|nr:uncharacterized mitochondrial protein AtMg00240-like [Gossypium hirsutum]